MENWIRRPIRTIYLYSFNRSVLIILDTKIGSDNEGQTFRRNFQFVTAVTANIAQNAFINFSLYNFLNRGVAINFPLPKYKLRRSKILEKLFSGYGKRSILDNSTVGFLYTESVASDRRKACVYIPGICV